MTVGLRSASGYFRRTSCVGMMLFLQYWYWYPLSYCLSLALQPSALIGLNADLKMPKMQVRSWHPLPSPASVAEPRMWVILAAFSYPARGQACWSSPQPLCICVCQLQAEIAVRRLEAGLL